MPGKSSTPKTAPEPSVQQPNRQQWEYLELLVGVGNEIWDSNGQKTDLREIVVGDPRFPRHYYSAAPLLGQLGREGWEVTGMIGDLSTYILVLKRPLLARAEPVEEKPGAVEPVPTRRAPRSVSERLQEQAKTKA